MRYVVRDDAGKIIAVYAEEPDFETDVVSIGDPELFSFLTGEDGDSAIRQALAKSDADLLRVVEDVINVLIDKNLLLLSDFPEAARQKVLRRAALRNRLQTGLL